MSIKLTTYSSYDTINLEVILIEDFTFDKQQFYIPTWEELPTIDLYMDQLLSYLERYLSSFIKEEKGEKFITKMMINNYVKQGVIEPPIKKKYTRTHISKLFVICILKQVYSIHDIQSLIRLALKTSSIEVGYNKFCSMLQESIESTFNGTEYSCHTSLTREQYILKNVTQSFVNKLYVQITFLKK